MNASTVAATASTAERISRIRDTKAMSMILSPFKKIYLIAFVEATAIIIAVVSFFVKRAWMIGGY